MPEHCFERLAHLAGAVLLALAATTPAAAQNAHSHASETRPAPAASGASPNFGELMNEAMATMEAGMTKAPMTGDPDHDFAAMMIPHHQGAVDMAKAVLLHGKNPVLRRLAQEIIVTQGSEIAVMRSELDKASVHPRANTTSSR